MKREPSWAIDVPKFKGLRNYTVMVLDVGLISDRHIVHPYNFVCVYNAVLVIVSATLRCAYYLTMHAEDFDFAHHSMDNTDAAARLG